MYKMGMGTAVAAALGKREMRILVIIYSVCCKRSDFFRKKICVIRNFDTLFLDFSAS